MLFSVFRRLNVKSMASKLLNSRTHIHTHAVSSVTWISADWIILLIIVFWYVENPLNFCCKMCGFISFTINHHRSQMPPNEWLVCQSVRLRAEDGYWKLSQTEFDMRETREKLLLKTSTISWWPSYPLESFFHFSMCVLPVFFFLQFSKILRKVLRNEILLDTQFYWTTFACAQFMQRKFETRNSKLKCNIKWNR